MIFGAHVSMAGNITNAITSAQKYQLKAIQVFSSPPRNWTGPQVPLDQRAKFKRDRQKLGLAVFVHAKYLVNLASANQETVRKSIESLIEDLRFSQELGATGVIMHPHGVTGPELIRNLTRVLDSSPITSWLILENSAQTKLEELAQVYKKLANDRLKLCLDTAHAFEAGYTLAQSLKIIHDQIGPKTWVVSHVNDSQTNFGSHHDIHANLGHGQIPVASFKLLVNDSVGQTKPMILETPELKSLTSEKINSLGLLKQLANQDQAKHGKI